MSIQALLEKRQKCIHDQEAILNACSTEIRNMTVDEKSTFDNLDVEIGSIEETVDKMKAFNDKIQAKNYDELETEGQNQFIEKNINKKDNGFESFGEMLQSVAKARTSGQVDKRLLNAASGASANVPSDGGFLISPTRSGEIWQKMYENGQILNRCSVYEIGQNSDGLEVPYVDETSRANGSRWGGLRAYWEGEVDTPTSSKTKLGKWESRLVDLKALVYVTERLLEDAPALESLVMSQIDPEFTFKIEDAIINGTGVGQPKGIVGDPGTVSVSAESGQSSTTIVAENLMKMYTRLWGRSRQGAAWFINQNIEFELMTMGLSIGAGGVPVYMPANGLSSEPYSTLFGKPIIPVEYCPTLGTVGDIIFANFSEYALIRKGGLRQASSIHVKFLTDEMTFKFNMRINGRNKWKSALTPYKSSGSDTLSPFVTLATR